MSLISLRRPSDAALADWLARQRDVRPSFEAPLPDVAPPGFDLDSCRLELGAGPAVFAAARDALRRWAHCDMPDHAECGVERFEVRAERDGGVVFEIRAVSRPARWWAAAGRPLVRAAQAQFRRDSPAALLRAVRAGLAAQARA